MIEIPASLSRTIVVGGAGFIGSHVVDALLEDPNTERVTVYDNFSSGREWHMSDHLDDKRLEVIKGEVDDASALNEGVKGHSAVIHLASNPDIARAVSEPAIDFDQGTLLTHRVLESARKARVTLMLYASGSGVYGDLGLMSPSEDHGPLVPVSTYGASKLAGEAMLSAYCHMFGFAGFAFRFGNVVGRRQTHGVGFDFVRRLYSDPSQLAILGDGQQSKSYIHVSDVIQALFTAAERGSPPYEVFNVATGDYATVSEIAYLAISVLGLESKGVRITYSGGDRGWKGDIPIVRLDTQRMRSIGWRNQWTSKDALRLAMEAILVDVQNGLVD